MNHELADGAHDRLDAQIAEALFGQPGMSKMDVANRVRELRGDGPALLVDVQPGGRVRLGDRPTIEKRARELLASAYADTGAPALLVDEVRGGKHDTASDNAALRAIVAALAAQPSPGGQGDARAIIEEFIQCAALGRPHGKLIAQAKDYLAARQPEVK
ncbi:hypothetical protein I5T88_06430 [Stenotrophomonas maltophilia]|nr:hypothetical protein [Stenotrophomonas maltophilia]